MAVQFLLSERHRTRELKCGLAQKQNGKYK